MEVAQRFSKTGYKCCLCNGRRLVQDYAVTWHNTKGLRKNTFAVKADHEVQIVSVSMLEKEKLTPMFKSYRVTIERTTRDNNIFLLWVVSDVGSDEFPYTNIRLPSVNVLGVKEEDKLWVYTTEAPVETVPEYFPPHIIFKGEKAPEVIKIGRYREDLLDFSKNDEVIYAEFNRPIEHKNRFNRKPSVGFTEIVEYRGNKTKIKQIDFRILDQMGFYTGTLTKNIWVQISRNPLTNAKTSIFDDTDGGFYGWLNPISLAVRTRNLLVCPEVTTAGVAAFNGQAIREGEDMIKKIKGLQFSSLKEFAGGGATDSINNDDNPIVDDDDYDTMYDDAGAYGMYLNEFNRNAVARHKNKISRGSVGTSYSYSSKAVLKTSIKEKPPKELSTFLVFDEEE
jgi:hypothetical protein